MYSIDSLAEIVDKGMRSITIPEDPNQLYEPIRYTLASGGKRIRPILVLAANNLFSKSVDKALFSALAIEVFHNFTLIHDDIMDNAMLRRNQPTVFNKWGLNNAILSGDAMNILAYQLIARTEKESLSQVFNVFNEIALGVCDGQQMDLNFESAHYVTQDEYIRMIELKTAILISGALRIGAIVAKANHSDINNLGEFGINLGLAFQLQDDLLDTFGNSKTFGKIIGGDIVANKKTFLTVKAFSLAKGKTLELLSSYFKLETIDPIKKVKDVTSIYNDLGIKEITEDKIKEYFNSAMSALDAVRVPIESKNTLTCIANMIMGRER
ncbi:MAG TPA: polyprenyl synthetase family protein [Tenuifilaceae bacterium]|nr:polyprenyl synthetase family protein [Tenuifilaceae bacterium]HPE17105.1 polyprenyl synthetase family protein [Tenuifilaceae bacterium]HPJ44831.1 polyprenyl synthetase family protein [Tenuifilaceae bacterium]HPQ32875.1 polyprenyl synthetase family protein [Tenuifilaceae bacterium]HRX67196.1 polyprenyl synthetase family protein [Tenuifilaceae bacterium]